MNTIWTLIVLFSPVNEPKRVLGMHYELTQMQCEDSARRINAKSAKSGYTAYCAYIPEATR